MGRIHSMHFYSLHRIGYISWNPAVIPAHLLRMYMSPENTRSLQQDGAFPVDIAIFLWNTRTRRIFVLCIDPLSVTYFNDASEQRGIRAVQNQA